METRKGKLPQTSTNTSNSGPFVKRKDKPATRSLVPVSDIEFDIDESFPQMKMFSPRNKLPTLASVVGMLRYRVSHKTVSTLYFLNY